MPSIFDNFFGTKNYGSSLGDIQGAYGQRQAQIGQFSQQLEGLRQQYLNQIPQLNQQAFKQYGQDAAAAFSGTGQSTAGGAFQSELARYAIQQQRQMYENSYGMGQSNLSAVNQSQGSAYQGYNQALAAGMSAPKGNPIFESLLGAGLTVGSLYALGGLFGAGGAAAGATGGIGAGGALGGAAGASAAADASTLGIGAASGSGSALWSNFGYGLP